VEALSPTDFAFASSGDMLVARELTLEQLLGEAESPASSFFSLTPLDL